MPTLRFALLPALLGAFLCFVAPARAATLNVPAQYGTIQAAVNASQNGDTVLIADGTYSGPGNRDIDFGGKNLTVTSQHGAASTVIDCGGFSSSNGSGNHRGFFIHRDETNAVISGLTIENGYTAYLSSSTDPMISGFGGGIFIDNSSVTIQNCVITGNAVTQGGGGIYINNNGATITMTDCAITNNSAANGFGGVVNLNPEGTITMTDCVINGNTGGIENANYISGPPNGDGTITLTNCTISDNKTSGGVANVNDNGTITLTNCTISKNSVSDYGGGGVFNATSGSDSTGTIALTNCTITGNFAARGVRGVFNTTKGGTIALTNCIVSGDSGGDASGDPIKEVYNDSGTPVISFCDIQGGYPGTGNINADPLFVYAAGGNLHLKPGSPCLGAGTSAGAPTNDEDGNLRPSPPSIGAYEVAAPGHTHLLWTNANGAASIWTLSPDGTVTSTPAYGPIPGWTAKTIADGPDGKTRLLWRRADGMSAVWTVNTADGTITSTPQGGWITVGLAVGSDNLTRLQWEIDPYKRVGLGDVVWTLDGAGNVTSTPFYDPNGPWTATALAVGGDGLSRLLWVNGGVPSGQYPFAVWTINGSGGVASTPLYIPQPMASWTATTIAGGPDTNTRLLLNRTDGAMAVWTVDVPGSVVSTPLYGPIPGWTCRALAVGPDALSRVLWSRSDGMSSVWTIAADGSIGSTPGYGPIPGWSAVALTAGP